MNPPKDLLELEKFKLLVELFNPNADNDREQEKLKEKDDIWKEKLQIIERR